jgi:hypothetical protein
METELNHLTANMAELEAENNNLRAELAELRAQVPVAYMHNKRVDVIHTSVKSLLSDFAVNSGPESMLRPIDKQEHYTIPLYAAPVPAQPAADVAAIAKAVRDIPSRIESLGGQRFAYVKLSEVIDTIYSMAGKHPAVPDDVAKDAALKLVSELQTLSEAAYGEYVSVTQNTECLGWKSKINAGTFGESELKAHRTADNWLGKHRAYSDAATKLAAILAAKENKP